ncbi:MAG: translocation/assembly module TamB domain-containing protein [Chlamydiales bacterium]|nr:translocation/assembly module TamB domain-containing protein [Chlamydiales bacterium]
MKRLIQLLLLFCLLTLLLIFVLLQTPAGKNHIKSWIETKMEGTLSVGEIEGLIPFWIRLHDVKYQTESAEANADTIDLFLSPTTFIFGKLSILRLYLDNAHVNLIQNNSSHSIEWPQAPFPINIHSILIDSLDLNRIKGISLSGKSEISEGFSLRMTALYQEYLLRFGLEADAVTKTIAVVAQAKEKDILDLWMTGVYDWKTQTFAGESHGDAYSWKIKTDLSLSGTLLNFSDTTVEKETLSLTGALSFDLERHSFQAEGNFFEHPYSAKGKLEWRNGEAALSDLFLLYAGNTLHGSLTLKEGLLTGELDLDLDNLSLFSIEGKGCGRLSIKPGEIDFNLLGGGILWKELSVSEVNLKGELKEGRLAYALAVRDFIVLDPAYEVFPTSHLNLTGEATGTMVILKGEVWGLGSQPFTLLADIPITFAPFDMAINTAAPLSISLKGKGSIDPILAFLENASLIARGDIDVDLSLKGTWGDPRIEGTLVYENGRIESLATGALFREIHMEFAGEGNTLKIQSMIAHDPSRGDLSGRGQIEWNPEKGFPFSFNIHTKQFTLLAIDPLTASTDARLTFSGNIHEMSITGGATIVDGHLAIPNKVPPQIPTLEVTYINPLPTPKPEIEEKEKTIPIYWDVQIEIPKRLTIDGRGLVSEWSGYLNIFGSQDALRYSGKLKLLQGRFTVVGRTFDLVEGKILIEGLDPKDIVVELKGNLELAAITASIHVNGSLDSTQVCFSSNPPMGTNQILSWILFNQDVNELTPFQACRLANVVVQLSGKYTGPNVFNNIKEGLGIDVFDITNCDIDSADLTFQVGKYISQGTFVGISKSLSGDFDSVLIQTRLYRNFYLEGDYGGSLNGLTPNGGKLIFKWYKTY